MKHAAVGGGREETSTKRKYDIPQSIQPCWFQDEWNKQLVCLNDWARDLFQWLVQPLSNNNIFIKWMEANDSNISSKITLLASYLKFLVHCQHEQASSCHLYHQCNTNEEPIIPYSKSATMCQTEKKIMCSWNIWNKPGFHLHQVLSCAHRQEQNHAALQHQSAGTCKEKYPITSFEENILS